MKTMKMNFKSLALVALVFTAVFAVSCNKEDFAPEQSFTTEEVDLKKGRALAPGTSSIAQIAIGAGFSELVNALVHVDTELNTSLVDMFMNGTDQYTVFAPTNDAFEALYEFLGVDGITEVDAELVKNVLFYHVTEGRRASNSVVPPVRPRSIETLLGVAFTVDSNGMITAVGNTANIVAADISASNGIIHVIDTVILPISME